MVKPCFAAIMILMFAQAVNAGGGIKFVVELQLYHTATDDDAERITFETGKQLYDSVGQCAKDRLSPQFKLGLKAYYHGKGIAMIKSRCKPVFQNEVGA